MELAASIRYLQTLWALLFQRSFIIYESHIKADAGQRHLKSSLQNNT